MKWPRRYFLGSSAVLLGSKLLEVLTTPSHRWSGTPELQGATIPNLENSSLVTFVDVADRAGLKAVNVWGGVDSKKYIIETKGTGLAFFDYDNDGWDDLFCCYWGHNVLWHNNGDGTFTDVTKKAGLWEDRVRWGTGCTWLDYDRDGFLDLFVCNYIELDVSKVPVPGQAVYCMWKGIPVLCGPRGLPAGTNILYHNSGDGTFADVSKKTGILEPGPCYCLTAVSYDFDNDGWPDIYVAVDSEPSILFQNKHDGTFEDIALLAALLAGCAYNEDGAEQAGMGLAVADYDCNGWLDIFKTNFADDTTNLYRNNGNGTFTDVASRTGFGVSQYVCWGVGFMDYDNDGWTDIFYVTGHVYPETMKYNVGPKFKTPRVVHKNLGDGKFEDVSGQLGPGVSACYSSRGCAFGDYDNDGDIDVVVLNMNDLPSLLRNDGGNKNNWIKIKLLGTKCNRTAIGARVRVVTGKHAQIDEVHSGTSVMSQSDLRLHFGVGQTKQIDAIEVKWPTTEKIEQFTNVAVNHILTIKEGSGIIKEEKPATLITS